MEIDREKLEATVRKCTDRLGNVTEAQVQGLVGKLVSMGDLQTVVDALALNISNSFAKPEDKPKYSASMEDLLQLADGVYTSVDEIEETLKANKAKNYTPGNISVEENHRLIESTLKTVADRLNELGVDYYVVGALSSFIGTQTPLFRYHGDLDFMVEEADIPKVREALEGTDYDFSDDRFDNKKVLRDGIGHTQGEHEVIANHKENEFHLGFFLFRREPDQSITVREYFMQENENGEKVPMVLERAYPKELADLEYTAEETEFVGTRFRTSTPESVYTKKMSTRHPKDLLDIEALQDKIDEGKIAQMRQYDTTLRVVPAEPTIMREEDFFQSAIEATQVVREGEMSEQLRNLTDLERGKAESEIEIEEK